jgi:uncharacterized membrane protein YeiB
MRKKDTFVLVVLFYFLLITLGWGYMSQIPIQDQPTPRQVHNEDLTQMNVDQIKVLVSKLDAIDTHVQAMQNDLTRLQTETQVSLMLLIAIFLSALGMVGHRFFGDKLRRSGVFKMEE